MLDLPDAADYDAAVATTDGIDRWCTSTDWVLPLTAAMRPHDPFVMRTGSGWGVFDRLTADDGRRVLMGVDRIWGFACPVVGSADVWGEMATVIADDAADVVVLPGMIENGPVWRLAVAALDPTHVLQRAGGITRCRADLVDGFDAWFGRRSTRFRQRMRRVRRDADDARVVVDTVSGPDLLDRLVAIEHQSWKGAERDGLVSPDMAEFYRLVLDRLGPERTRCLVARSDGRDVGYIVGGVRGPTYRGLQLSSTDDVRSLGVGHLLQLEQIERLCAEGLHTYDLGMDMAYKQRWADHTVETTTIAAFPREPEDPFSGAAG